MTDKEQIMIDGVDIMDCDYYYVEQATDQVKCDNYGGYCQEHENCPFKQLTRKTQECEQKEKELLSNEKIINKLMKEVDELKQECEEYKKRAVCFKDVNKQLGYKYLTIKQECEELKEEIINKNEKIKELRFSVSDLTNRLCNLNAEQSFRIVDLEQALNEIEKYQKRNCETCSFYKTDKCGISCQTFVIIDIINKAKDGNNE